MKLLTCGKISLDSFREQYPLCLQKDLTFQTSESIPELMATLSRDRDQVRTVIVDRTLERENSLDIKTLREIMKQRFPRIAYFEYEPDKDAFFMRIRLYGQYSFFGR